MSIFGRIVTGHDLSTALLRTARLWSPSYIGELSAHSGRDRSDLSPFRSFTTATDFSKFSEDQLPACIAIVPETAPEAVRKARGGYDARWMCGLAAVVSGPDQETTDELCKLYTAALRALLIQHPSLADFDDAGNSIPFSDGLTWLGESYDEIDETKRRSIAGGIVTIEVQINDVIDPNAGPLRPPIDPSEPPPNWGIVTSTS